MAESAQFIPHSHIPYGDEGEGFYSDHTLGCYDVIAAAQPLVLRALDLVPSGDGAITICDYGTADGGTSMFLLGSCIAAIKKKEGDGKEVMVYYEDQPSNDFKSLFKRIHGQLPGTSSSYALQYPGVYTACVGSSFFSRCFPANSIQLGFSFSAMHWLSGWPCTLRDSLHHTGSKVETEKEHFRSQAAKDWETILLARAHELTQGGQVVIVCLSVDEEGQYLGNTKRIKNSMFEHMTSHWANMATEGKITQEEFVSTTFNNYYRTAEECRAPLEDTSSSVYNAGLRLVSMEMRVVPCHYQRKWAISEKKDDPEAAKAHAKWYIPTTRTWSNSVFRSGLNSSRNEAEKDDLVDEVFRRYEADVASAPEDHGMDYVHAYIHIQKIVAQ